MKRPWRGGLVVVVLLLAGCGPSARWVKLAGSDAEFNQDNYDCALQSSGAYTTGGLPPGGKIKINENLYRACLRAKGYSKVKTEVGWKGLDD
jgi:hypothetical protein